MSTRYLVEEQASVWGSHATQWSRLGSPLRPSSEDTERYARVVRLWTREYGEPRIALWGVTPEIVMMPLPDGARILSFDSNLSMLRLFPAARLRQGSRGICADWRRLPLADGSRDIVLGDGCFALVSFPDGFRTLAREVTRILSQTGVCAFRFYLRPEPVESIDDVVADLRMGWFESFHAFKLRAAMALQESSESGIAVRCVWDWWRTSGINGEELAAQYGWDAETIATIDAYRDRPDVYTFPTISELRSVIGDLLEEVDCQTPKYELGERCPVIELAPRGTRRNSPR